MMKKIKKVQYYLALAIVSLMIFGACSNGNDDVNDEASFLICKIDGTLREFNYSLSANDRPEDFNSIHFVTIGGLEEKDPAKSPGFDFQLVSDEGAKETTYTVANGQGPELIGQYYIQTSNGTTSYRANGNTGSSFTLTITSITKWGVKGTFSGVLHHNGTYKTVTDGEFAAPYNKN